MGVPELSKVCQVQNFTRLHSGSIWRFPLIYKKNIYPVDCLNSNIQCWPQCGGRLPGNRRPPAASRASPAQLRSSTQYRCWSVWLCACMEVFRCEICWRRVLRAGRNAGRWRQVMKSTSTLDYKEKVCWHSKCLHHGTSEGS